MKERNILYFISAVVASVLFIVALIPRFFPWFYLYGDFVVPPLYALFIPLAILWLSWFFENRGFFLSAAVIHVVVIIMHLGNVGLLNGDIYVVSAYAPMVRTIYTLTFILLAGIIVFGFYTYLKEDLKPKVN